MVGLDLIEIDRLERALERRPKLGERVFTEAERAFAAARARPGQHLAVRFAAKEAALKALGLGGLRLHEVEVVGGGDQPPRIELHLSLTHSRELAAAVVVARPAAP